MATAKKKVAILGGGVGAMTAAFELSNAANRDNYDITVYQMGWRLGGQGASGRDQKKCNRIEEHGLHAWGGFYENAFRVMRECYEELGREPGQPLARIWDPSNPDATDVAFKQHSNVVFSEFTRGEWNPWPFTFLPNQRLPGMPDSQLPGPDELVRNAVRALLQQLPVVGKTLGLPFGPLETALLSGAVHALGLDRVDWDTPGQSDLGQAAAAKPEPLWEQFLEAVKLDARELLQSLWKKLGVASPAPGPATLPPFIEWLKELGARLENSSLVRLIDESDELRRGLILLDFTRVLIVGAYADNIFEFGFDPLEDFDFREWLKRNGAMDITLDSVLVRGFYDYMFAFVGGDPSRPRMSAGMALWHSLRLTCTYHGSVFWLMQAGMGDTVFAPFYQVLKKRGVQFKFFHRVDNMIASADTKAMTSIELTQQVRLKSGNDDDYNPLFPVKGLDCWPSEPLWDQIEEGDTLGKLVDLQHFDLESPFSTLDPDLQAKCETKITLQAGVDFDLVISNISIAALKTVGQGLLPANPALGATYFGISAISTMAVQIWLLQTFEELGWTRGEPILTGFERPNSTWGAMTHLLPREEWESHVPVGARPKALAYFCGPYFDPDEFKGDRPFTEWMYAHHSRVEAVARQWFQDNSRSLFPKATQSGNPTALNYSELCINSIDPMGRVVVGEDFMGLTRFNAQYYRGNRNPCDRYVIALPGDRDHRPREGDSGIQNLYFVGDWIYTGLGGCVESAAMSALMVVRRLTGSPQVIVGELPQTRLGYHRPPKIRGASA